MQNVTVQKYTIPNEVLQQSFQQWKGRWEKWVQSQGEYFKGD